MTILFNLILGGIFLIQDLNIFNVILRKNIAGIVKINYGDLNEIT